MAEIYNRKAVIVSGAKRILMCLLHGVHKLALVEESRVHYVTVIKFESAECISIEFIIVIYSFSPPLIQCNADFK